MLKFVFDTNVFVSALISKIKLQHLKTLERAPHGTLAFRSYLLRRYSTILCNKAFGGLEALRVK
jgi:predicted nucleic acid-binding protein